MKAEHPVLVLSTKAFNERTGVAIGLLMAHAQSNETNAFAIRYVGPKTEVGYVLTHQLKSLDWRQLGARSHPWKQVTPALFQDVCDELNSIISICV